MAQADQLPYASGALLPGSDMSGGCSRPVGSVPRASMPSSRCPATFASPAWRCANGRVMSRGSHWQLKGCGVPQSLGVSKPLGVPLAFGISITFGLWGTRLGSSHRGRLLWRSFMLPLAGPPVPSLTRRWFFLCDSGKPAGRSLLFPPLAMAGRYETHSRPLAPSTENSCGYCERKCFSPWSVFFKYRRTPCDSATPSMLRRSWPLPGDAMYSRHSIITCSFVTPDASHSSSSAVAVPSLVAVFLKRSLFGRSEKRNIST
mmetsp:Transcript_126290/g.357165  ORF Transcript_126290/g.357165 Transcript_126290/m.357165 type:complete len:260 (-) Transcript_126290:342-1121(-)